MQQANDVIELAAPTGPKISRELLGLVQVPRLAMRSPKLIDLPRGDQTVVAFPGFGTNDLFTFPLRSALSALGHTTFGWGFGVNKSQVEEMLDSATAMVERHVDATGQPAALIGWSNGGVFAREVARDRPDLVTRVLTYGTPVVGGPKYTRGVALFSDKEVDRIDAVVAERNLIPIERPITAFYSRADVIVDWRACIDAFSPDVENIEVRSTHAAMGIDPDIWERIALRLAER